MSRFFLFLLVFGVSGMPFSVRAAAPYTPPELAHITKPSVARIVTHTFGKAEITPVVIDIKRGLIAVPDMVGGVGMVEVDEHISGSGVIVHPDGYIATNAHLVSQTTIKQRMAAESALAAFYQNALFLSETETQAFLESDEAESFMRRVVQTVIDNSRFELHTDVFVLNPRSDKEKVVDLVQEAFPATVESLDENFLENDRDVALIKIDLDHLPALPITSSETLSVGSTAYIFGFPGTAELNTRSPLEATFTQGVVSAIKAAAQKDFPIYQTDAKVSQGSSGGPLFNDHGEVVGLITFQTGELERASGDGFAFALPTSLIVDEATKIGLTLNHHEIFTAFTRGIDAVHEKHCQTADGFFRETEAANDFFSLEKYVASYRARCLVLQSNGQALDTRWETLRNQVGGLGVPTLSLFGVALFILVLFGVALFWLIRQVKHEEAEITVLMRRVKEDERRFLERKYGSERIDIRLTGTSNKRQDVS